MKKTIKIISLSLVLIFFCVTLCGCVSLDEMRAFSAIIVSDDIVRLYDGTEYKRLSNTKGLTPNISLYGYVDAVEEEVPILLVYSRSVKYFDKSDDGNFLIEYDDYGNEILYCNTEIYDYVVNQIEIGYIAEKCRYSYTDYRNGEELFYTLSKSQLDAVIQVIRTVEPERHDVTSLLFDYYVDLYLYTDDDFFRKETVDICVINNTYYVLEYSNHQDKFEGYAKLYKVPKELLETFKEIAKKEIEAYDYMYN